MQVALVLDHRSCCAPDRAGDTAAELQIVVRRVDNCVDLLHDEIAAHDHDSGLRLRHISFIRSSNRSRSAPAMPRTPIDSMVKEAQATPHTSASCRPHRWAPVLSQRASIPPASASPAPVVSKAVYFVSAGTWTLPSAVYVVTPSCPALRTRPSSHHCRRNSSGSRPP